MSENRPWYATITPMFEARTTGKKRTEFLYKVVYFRTDRDLSPGGGEIYWALDDEDVEEAVRRQLKTNNDAHEKRINSISRTWTVTED